MGRLNYILGAGMYDLVIRGGTIVDGTGSDSVVGDLAINGEKIVQVGGFRKKRTQRSRIIGNARFC